MGFHQFSAVSLPILLLACVPQMTVPSPEPMPPVLAPADQSADACGAANMQSLVGQPFSALAAMTFPGPMRLIRPGMAVTMDYSAERLNITVNASNVIASVTCG